MKNVESGRCDVDLTVVDTFFSARGGKANVLQATPLKATDESLPLYFHGGYGVMNAPYLQYIAQQYGRRVFTVFYDDRRQRDRKYWIEDYTTGEGLRSVGRKEARRLQSLHLGSVVSQSQIDMGTDLLIAAERRGFERIEAIAQSVGALRTVAAGKQAPGVITNMVLPYPAGCVSAEIGRVVKGMGNYVKSWRQREYVARDDTIHASIGWDLPVFEKKRFTDIITDGENVLLSCHVDDLHQLRKHPNSPGIAIIAGEDDQIMMPHRILESMVNQEDIDYMEIIRGLHAIRHRKAVVGLIMRQFARLEKRKEERLEITRNHIPSQPLRERIGIEPGVSNIYAKIICESADLVPTTS